MTAAQEAETIIDNALAYSDDGKVTLSVAQAHQIWGALTAPTKAIQQCAEKISSRLDAHLCTMKPDYDDSITGFNEAWDIVRKVFEEEK